MDVAKYKALFLEESREHLAELSRLLVAIETSTDPGPLIDDVFRRVHSIKGMAASMGYTELATLAHRFEDVVAGARDAHARLDANAIDLVLKGIDGMSAQVQAAADDAPMPPLESLVRAVDALLARSASPAIPAVAAPTFEPLPAPGVVASLPVATGSPAGILRRVIVRLAPDCKAPAVRLFMAHKQLGTLGTIVTAHPPIDEIRRGHAVTTEVTFDWVSEARDETVLKLLGAITDVMHVELLAQPTLAAPPAKVHSEAATEGAKTVSTVRVRTEVLDSLIDNVGELLILRQRLERLLGDHPDSEMKSALDGLANRIREMRDQVMAVRMMPMKVVTDRMPRLVRDLARNLGKEVELTIEGDAIELDRAILDNLDTPFVHTLRNAVDHGIESREERLAAGKPALGQVRIVASRDRDTVVVVISDDGRGLDVEALKARAVRQGFLLPRQAEQMSTREALFLICTPGFSTKTEVSGVSGRGVGMDVVRAKIDALGGTLDIESDTGRGTRFVFRLPLTVAIINALLVESCHRVFAVPVAKVVSVREMGDDVIHEANGATYLSFRHALAPVVSLGALLDLNPDKVATFAVVLEDSRDLVAVAVDRVVGYQEIVVKPLGDPLDRLEWFSGATILGDGQPILILDLPKAMRARMAA